MIIRTLKEHAFSRNGWRVNPVECCNETGQRNSIGCIGFWGSGTHIVSKLPHVSEIFSSNVTKTAEVCSTGRFSDRDRDVNSERVSIDGLEEEAKLMRKTMVVDWSKQASETRGWLSLWVSDMTLPQEHFGCRVGILNDAQNVSGHISVETSSSGWHQSRVVIAAHHTCCGTMFEGHHKSNLLLENDGAGENPDMVTLIYSEGSRHSVRLRPMNYARIIRLTVWLDIHSNPLILWNSPSICMFLADVRCP